MVKQIKLAAKTRAVGKEKPAEIRRAGYVPGVYYGSGATNVNLKIKANDLIKVYDQAGETNLVDLEIEGKEPSKVIIKAVEKDPVKDTLIHVDFYQVDMAQAIEVETPIHFIGESKAVKDLNAVLLKNLETITIKCLPGDLVEFIEVDLSVLNVFDDIIKVSDLKLPDTLEVLNPPTEMIANVSEARIVEEEEEKPVIETEGEAGEGEGEGEASEKKDGEKPAEAEGAKPKKEKNK